MNHWIFSTSFVNSGQFEISYFTLRRLNLLLVIYPCKTLYIIYLTLLIFPSLCALFQLPGRQDFHYSGMSWEVFERVTVPSRDYVCVTISIVIHCMYTAFWLIFDLTLLQISTQMIGFSTLHCAFRICTKIYPSTCFSELYLSSFIKPLPSEFSNARKGGWIYGLFYICFAVWTFKPWSSWRFWIKLFCNAVGCSGA